MNGRHLSNRPIFGLQLVSQDEDIKFQNLGLLEGQIWFHSVKPVKLFLVIPFNSYYIRHLLQYQTLCPWTLPANGSFVEPRFEHDFY